MAFKKVALKILKISIPAIIIALLFAELVVRIFFDASERPSTFYDTENKIVKYSNHITDGTYTVGLDAAIKGRWHINEQGWNSTVNFSEKTDLNRIAIIGDSYVEGFHVNVEDRFSELLRTEVSDSIDIIELGRAGAPLSQYLHMARYCYKKYQPNTFVFNVVYNDFDGSLSLLNNAEHFLRLDIKEAEVVETEIKPYPEDRTNSVWKNSALIRYLYYNAKLGTIGSVQHSKEAYEKAVKEHQQKIEENTDKIILGIDYVFSCMLSEFPDVRIIVILDASRPCIYTSDYEACTETKLFKACEEICLDKNIEVVNMGPIMQAHYKEHSSKFEYEEDVHWNRLGHQLVFEALLNAL